MDMDIHGYTIHLNLTLSDPRNKNSFCQIFGLSNHLQGLLLLYFDQRQRLTEYGWIYV